MSLFEKHVYLGLRCQIQRVHQGNKMEIIEHSWNETKFGKKHGSIEHPHSRLRDKILGRIRICLVLVKQYVFWNK